jgi:hypothetical protein
VVRELPSGRETSLDPGLGFVRNLQFDRTGRTLLLEGGPDGRVQPLAFPSADCDGAGSCIVRPYEGPFARRSIPVGGGPAVDIAEFVHETPVAAALGPPTVSGPKDYDFVRGIWARRADGARLGVPGRKRAPLDDGPVPRGPLLWRR